MRRCLLAISVVLVATGALELVPAALSSPAVGDGARGDRAYAVPAVRQRLTDESRSPVAHDTETMALVAHSGRLFAATDQWEYQGPHPAGQVLMKASATSPWQTFEQTQSKRVQALDSFAIPGWRTRGKGHSLLITQAIVHGHSEIQWLVDRADSFQRADSYRLASMAADVRAFGAHESGGRWAVYAGVNPTGILRGTWSAKRHTLVFARRPELTAAPPAAPGLKTQKVTAFADCAGALYVTINTRLFRRNDGALRSGRPRWTLVYEAPPVGPRNSGLRGLTCITHDGSPALLASIEGSGDVYRFDHLPRGPLPRERLARRLRPILEFSPATAIARMLAREGTHVPRTGTGSINYVIAAYNNIARLPSRGPAARRAFGVEWHYNGACPPGRTCQPTGFDASACFVVRSDRARSPSYRLHCLTGPRMTPTADPTTPVRSGQAFVSIRTIVSSPFGDRRVYYGGYDCNFYPADGTAWIAASTESALR